MAEASISLLRSERRRLFLVIASYIAITFAFLLTAQIQRAMADWGSSNGAAFAAIGSQPSAPAKALAGIFSRLPLRPGIVPANAVQQPAAPLGTAEPLVNPGTSTGQPQSNLVLGSPAQSPPGGLTPPGDAPSGPTSGTGDAGDPPVLGPDNNVPLPASVPGTITPTDPNTPPPLVVPPIPEPGSWLMMMLGVLVVGLAARHGPKGSNRLRLAQ